MQNMSLLTGGSWTHKTSASAWKGIGRCQDRHRPVPRKAMADLLRDFLKFLALVRHHTMSGRAPGISYLCGERCVQSQVLPTFAIFANTSAN